MPENCDLPTLLKDRDIFCPVCEYNLRNLTSSHCPECGLELSIPLLFDQKEKPDVTNWAWIILVIALMGNWRHSLEEVMILLRGFLIDNTVLLAGRPINVVDVTAQYTLRFYWASLLPFMLALIVFRKRFYQLANWFQWTTALVFGAAFICREFVFLKNLFWWL